MGKKVYQCKKCGDDFSARVADRKRGWARFCSKSCKASHQERRTGQYKAFVQRQYFGDEDDGCSGYPFFNKD